jgi:signal transduction histidine kinase
MPFAECESELRRSPKVAESLRGILRAYTKLLRSMPNLTLHEFIATNREQIVRGVRANALARTGPRPGDSELDRGIPLFLDQLESTLRRSTSQTDVTQDHAADYGADLYRMGFTVGQVVHGYGDVCQAVTELALDLDASISVDDFRLFNRSLDDAIAAAVTEYEKRRIGVVAAEGLQRVALLSHELRNALHTAMLGFGILKMGAVGTDSSTATIVTKSLTHLHDLLERSLAEVRLETGKPQRSRIMIRDLFEDAEIALALEGENRGVAFTVASVPALAVDADILLLSGALTNLVQNAFKFTRPSGLVTLAARASRGRVFLDVEDECGGLPSGKNEELFRLFEQQSADRSGLGVGLSIARTNVRAMNGEIHVRDLPGKGCIFTIELPQSQLEIG